MPFFLSLTALISIIVTFEKINWLQSRGKQYTITVRRLKLQENFVSLERSPERSNTLIVCDNAMSGTTTFTQKYEIDTIVHETVISKSRQFQGTTYCRYFFQLRLKFIQRCSVLLLFVASWPCPLSGNDPSHQNDAIKLLKITSFRLFGFQYACAEIALPLMLPGYRSAQINMKFERHLS